jgi:hypothetical protein
MEAAAQTTVTPFPCNYWILSVKYLTLWSEYKHHYHPKKETEHTYPDGLKKKNLSIITKNIIKNLDTKVTLKMGCHTLCMEKVCSMYYTYYKDFPWNIPTSGWLKKCTLFITHCSYFLLSAVSSFWSKMWGAWGLMNDGNVGHQHGSICTVRTEVLDHT